MQKKITLFFKEPFIQFLILGGVLFLFNSFMRQRSDRQSREITIDNAQIGLMMGNYKTQTGVLPTKQQLDAMIENYIREEISYREAKKMGLDKDDEIIRRRLSQKFDFLQTDISQTNSPSEEDLKQFYLKNPSLFETDETVSFSHIYFSTDHSTDSVAKQRALTALQQLRKSGLQHAPEKGDHFALQYDYTDQAPVDIRQNFGDKSILDTLFKAPVGNWAGPAQSGYGWHLLYISNRKPATRIPFASIKDEVKVKFLDARNAEQNKKLFDRLSKKYIVNRAYLEGK
jgi:peptidyl-prolyl cis-trans isomerase C